MKALPVPGMQKPPRRVGKRFRDRLVEAPEKKVKKPAGLKNKTRLVVARPPGRESGGLPLRHGLPGLASTAVEALRWLTALTLSRDPTRIVKEQRAIVERPERQDHAATMDPKWRGAWLAGRWAAGR